MNNLINDILTDWAYRVPNGIPDPTNEYHLVYLRESMESLNVDGEVMDMVMNHLYDKKLIPEAKKKSGKLKVVKGQNPTTVYHEVLCALAMKGSLGNINNGNDILKAIKSGKVKPGVPKKEFKINKKHISYLQDSIHEKMEALKTDAKSIVNSIETRIGKHTSGPVWWAGPSNDSTDYGAADMVIKTKKHGWVGVSLKAGKGQLKNLTITTFFKALGVPLGSDGQAKTHFLENYKSNWDAMTKDWVTLAEKTFNSKSNDKSANEIFKKHIKTTWDEFQKEKISEGELDILTASVGMGKLTSKKKGQFKYFLHKMGNHFYGQKSYPGWNAKRTKHFADIFGKFETDYEGEIQVGLSELFARQMSVSKKNMFYAASAGKTIWFIPSQELFDKSFDPDSFVAQFRTEESGSGYNFMMDVGTIDGLAIGTIKITFRFKQGQMTTFPDTTSDYKLYADDWSKILGIFEK